MSKRCLWRVIWPADFGNFIHQLKLEAVYTICDWEVIHEVYKVTWCLEYQTVLRAHQTLNNQLHKLQVWGRKQNEGVTSMNLNKQWERNSSPLTRGKQGRRFLGCPKPCDCYLGLCVLRLIYQLLSAADVLLGACRDWNAAVNSLALGKLEGQQRT